MNLIEIARELGTEEECFAFLEKQRWPDVVRCAVCGCNRISRIERKSKTKNVRKNLYQCLESTCKQQFSVTSGTIFNDTRTPLTKWFTAINLIMDAKKGISAMQLQRHLGLGSYQTAWHMCHRIREAMQGDSGTKLKGIVEIDETYIGGRAKRRDGSVKNRKPRSEKFDMVLGMKERDGRVRMVHIPDGKAATIRAVIEENVVPFPHRLYTDSAAVYDFSLNPELKKRHRAVNHSIEWVVPGSKIHTNGIESAFSLFKRGITGSFHHVSAKHLHRYLKEFEHRFNRRKLPTKFTDLIFRSGQTSPLTYRTLVGK
jgi:transposase-like protein